MTDELERVGRWKYKTPDVSDKSIERYLTVAEIELLATHLPYDSPFSENVSRHRNLINQETMQPMHVQELVQVPDNQDA